jgi:hypothetical protein
MKTIFGTLVAFGLVTGAAQAKVFDEFNNPSLPLPRSAETAVSNDKFSEALPRISNDDFQAPLPVAVPSVDIVIATP